MQRSKLAWTYTSQSVFCIDTSLSNFKLFVDSIEDNALRCSCKAYSAHQNFPRHGKILLDLVSSASAGTKLGKADSCCLSEYHVILVRAIDSGFEIAVCA